LPKNAYHRRRHRAIQQHFFVIHLGRTSGCSTRTADSLENSDGTVRFL
jgi:hypothetical protein